MKKRAISIGIVATLILTLGALIIVGAPDRRWALVIVGMKADNISRLIGKPDHSLRQSKGIEIWNRGTLFRTSSIVVLYYEAQAPETATQVMRSTVWCWERI